MVRAETPYETLEWETWERGSLRRWGTVTGPVPAADLAERARRMGPTAAARGLGNRPVSDADCPFKKEHFSGPTPLPPKAYLQRVLFADPAGDATKLKSGDPDWCAVVALGLHPKEHCWEVFLAERMRGAPSAQARFIARQAVKAEVRLVWQEAVKDEALVEVTQRALRDMRAPIAVKPEKPTINKEVRIVQTLEPALAADPALLRVCGKKFPELRTEALAFPAASHDDLLDAFSGAFQKAPRYVPAGPSRRRKDRESERDRILRGYCLEGEGLAGW